MLSVALMLIWRLYVRCEIDNRVADIRYGAHFVKERGVRSISIASRLPQWPGITI
jgi:hypothetical protein